MVSPPSFSRKVRIMYLSNDDGFDDLFIDFLKDTGRNASLWMAYLRQPKVMTEFQEWEQDKHEDTWED